MMMPKLTLKQAIWLGIVFIISLPVSLLFWFIIRDSPPRYSVFAPILLGLFVIIVYIFTNYSKWLEETVVQTDDRPVLTAESISNNPTWLQRPRTIFRETDDKPPSYDIAISSPPEYNQLPFFTFGPYMASSWNSKNMYHTQNELIHNSYLLNKKTPYEKCSMPVLPHEKHHEEEASPAFTYFVPCVPLPVESNPENDYLRQSNIV